MAQWSREEGIIEVDGIAALVWQSLPDMGCVREAGVGDEGEDAPEGFVEHGEVVCAEEDGEVALAHADFDRFEAEVCHLGLDLGPPLCHDSEALFVFVGRGLGEAQCERVVVEVGDDVERLGRWVGEHCVEHWDVEVFQELGRVAEIGASGKVGIDVAAANEVRDVWYVRRYGFE